RRSIAATGSVQRAPNRVEGNSRRGGGQPPIQPLRERKTPSHFQRAARSRQLNAMHARRSTPLRNNLRFKESFEIRFGEIPGNGRGVQKFRHLVRSRTPRSRPYR